jgi:hypothetical protein
VVQHDSPPAVSPGPKHADPADRRFKSPEDGTPWLARNPLRSAFLLVTLLSLAIRASVLKDSYFITDDFMLSTRAVENPLSWSYLTRVHTGHFEPIGFGAMWLLTHLAPLNWGWTVVGLVAGQLLLSVLVWQLLVELFGRKPLILVPYIVFSFTPLTLPAFTWLSAAIIWLPLMIATAGATRWHVRFVRSGRPRHAAAAVAWFVVGLASFEKILLFLPFVVVLTVAVEPQMRISPSTLVALVRRTAWVWVGYGIALAAYLAIYLPGVRSAGNASPVTAPSPGPLSDFVFLSVFRTLIPGVFGGPWSWQPANYGLAIVDSPRAFDWACWIAALLVVVGSLVLRRNVGRFWTAFLVYLLGSIATIAVGRVAYGGAIVALETRYLADAAVPLVITLGACLLPLRGEADPWTPQAHRLASRVPPVQRLGALAGATSVMVALSIHSIGGYAGFSTANPARAFVANTRASLATLPEGVQVYDTEMPAPIIGPLFGDYNLVSRYLAPFRSDRARVESYGRRSFDRPYVLDASGRVVPMKVDVAASSTTPAGQCTPAAGGTATVPLNVALFEWGWVVRLGYLADADATATVELGAGRETVTLREGLGEVYVSVVGAGDAVRLMDVPRGVAVCVGDVQVGKPVPR